MPEDETPTVDYSDPGGWGLSDVAASGTVPDGDDLAAAPDISDKMPQATAPTQQPQETEEAEPTTEVKAEAQPAKQEAEKSTEAPAEAAEPTAPTDAQVAILKLAAKALGVTETDPAKLAGAIEAKQAEIETQAKAAEEAQEAQRQSALEDSWTQAAVNATHTEIMGQLEKAGWTVDANGKNIWDAATWEDVYEDPASYVQELTRAYNELRASPLTESFYHAKVNEAKAGYEQFTAKVADATAKYPHYDPATLKLMRDNGVDASIIETVLRSTHENTLSAIATTNSALASATQELTSLREQVSGFEAAIAKAKADGAAEGKAAALAEIQAGRELPNTTGLGGTSEAPLGVKGVFDDPGGWSLKDFQKEFANHR